MSDILRHGHVLETLRVQAGSRLHELQNASSSNRTSENEKRLAMAWDEFGQKTGLLSGYVFGLKSVLSADQFKEVLRSADVDDVELKDLLIIAKKFTRPPKETGQK
jgi:hypothetical protein